VRNTATKLRSHRFAGHAPKGITKVMIAGHGRTTLPAIRGSDPPTGALFAAVPMVAFGSIVGYPGMAVLR